MKFSEMEYIRPDMEKIGETAEKCASELTNAADVQCALNAYMKWDETVRHFKTALNLCYIRHSVDTLDEFYSNENDFFDDNSPVFTEYGEKVAKALARSKFRPELEKELGKIVFTNTDLFLSGFSKDNIPLMQEDNKLISEYEKLIASAQIDFEGKKLTLSELGPFKQSPDSDVRHRAWRAESGFFTEHKEELDRIYDDMVKLRTEQGRNLGFKDFVKLGYINMERNCYDADDIAAFRRSVIDDLVPLAEKLYKAQAKRTGCKYPLRYEDMSLTYPDGNAVPKGNAEDILEAGRRFYRSLSPQTGEFFDFMLDNELMDVLSRKGKMQGGYCTEIADHKCPFIFANFNGTQGDVEVVTHEAGHAFAAYVNRDTRLIETMLPTIEACEIHSMTMELFAYSAAEDFFGDQADKYIYKHLSDAIEFIPYGTMVDHFQHIVYEHPEMTPAERIEEWKRLTGIYMPWVDLDGSPFYGEGRAWQRQGHIYECPFYYIDYCLAQTVALEFWVMMQENRQDAFERYMKLVSLGGTRTFTELVGAAGLESPFSGSVLRTAAEKAEKFLMDNRFDACR